MAAFKRTGPGAGGTETFFTDIITRLERGLEGQRGYIAKELEATVRDRIKRGVNTGRYSTQAGWFSLTPGGRTSRYGRLIAAADEKRRLRAPRPSSGKVGIVGAGYFEQGYAQFRSVYRGEAFRTAPVTFELTGEFMRSLRGVARRTGRGEVTAYLGFKRQERTYGRITNRRLAEILALRGGSRNPFQPNARESEHILAAAARRAKADAKR